ncbi:hypothetical protein MRX96_027947 [Rhipicephalus microplus]
MLNRFLLFTQCLACLTDPVTDLSEFLHVGSNTMNLVLRPSFSTCGTLVLVKWTPLSASLEIVLACSLPRQLVFYVPSSMITTSWFLQSLARLAR